MTVVQYEAPPPLPPSRPGDELLEGPAGDVARLRGAAEYAAYIADTDFVPQALRGNPAAIAAAMLAGAEVGLKPMASLRMVAVIRGRPTLTAEAQRGLVVGAGHELWFEESTVTRAIAAGRRKGSDRIGRVTWTLDDAKRAGIAGGEAWRRYPAEMLRARASAALARAMFSDVTLGIPATEELEGEPDNGLDAGPSPEPPTDAAPPTSATRTRRRRTAAATGNTAPVTPPAPPDDQPTPEIPPEPPATEAMRRKLFALFRDAGVEARDDQLAYIARTIGRTIESRGELTIGEATRLIDQLEAEAENGTPVEPSAPVPASDPPADAEPAPPAAADTGAHSAEHEERLARLDELVTGALERGTTVRDLYAQIAAFRRVMVDDLVAELGGRDPTGRLLWSPLRNSLRGDELADLLVALVGEQASFSDDDIGF